MSSHNIVAIVPMRHSSERVPGKNYRDFAGRPMFYWIIKSLLDSEVFDQVVIDTDSPTIMKYAKEHFPEVLLLERPDHLKNGAIPMNDVILNVVNQVRSRYYFQTHSTNPILKANTVSRAVNLFFDNYPVYDSLFSVTARYTRYWDGLTRPINHNQNILLRTQDLPPVYEENSCMYIFTKEILEEKHNRIGARPFMFEMEEIESQDIDVELNFQVAEFLFKQVNQII